MNKYKMFFQIFDKKMQTIIEASSESEAEEELRCKIQIDKIECIERNKEEKINYSNLNPFEELFPWVKKK